MNNILNIAAYQFVSLSSEQTAAWRIIFKNQALLLLLKGTILLSQEGINLFLAGRRHDIEEFQNFLRSIPEFRHLNFRQTWSEAQPFKRLRVRIKKEIISMGHEEIQPEKHRAPFIDPQTLREWYQQKRPMMLLDTRNQYEVDLGTFDDAIHLGLKNFRSFPEASTALPAQARQMPLVTFCTGGIRCEKAALWLKKQGYPQVYQLRGGILNYLEQCGSDYYRGQCFVFDERAVIDEHHFKEDTYGDCANFAIS